MNHELRRSPRHIITLPLRVASVDGLPAVSVGETRDIGAGGVGFVVPLELPVGKSIAYEITLSTCGAGARIRCAGTILRCERRGEAWKIAATMARYHFAGTGNAESAGAETVAPPESRGEAELTSLS